MKSKTFLLIILSFLTTTYILLGNINFLRNKIKFTTNEKVLQESLNERNGPICGNYQNISGNSSYNDAEPMLWSASNTWASFGVTKPIAGSAVTIPADKYIILDESVNLSSLTINGKLEFADQNINLTSGWILVNGKFAIGSEAVPYTKQAVITLNAGNISEQVMGMGTRGIMVMGGELELHGTPPTKVYTKLNDNSAAGATTVNLADNVNWQAGNQVVFSTTDYYGAANATAQKTTISAVNGTSLSIQNGLNAQRWGKLQYLTPNGMSLTYQAPPSNILPGTPTVLDERGEVGNLTRNIVIQSVDDNLWQNQGFGCHIMIMKSGGVVGKAHLNGVEIRRGGQAGKLGRYPFHWHMLSYSGSTTLPDVTGQYIRNSVINQSAQRGIVIHGTNGAEVSNNIVYDVRGHGIFTEDASERRNIINGNLVLKIRNPLSQHLLKVHESEGSSGFWISNPDNTITNNSASDCEGFGFWLAFPKKTFGESSQIQLNPSIMKFGVFNSNHAHSNQNEGIFIDNVEDDALGNTTTNRYTSTTNMQEPEWPYDNVLTYEIADYTSWKNNTSGIWNRSSSVRNRRVVSADNTSSFFSGASDDINSGAIERSLIVGVSLNYNMNGVTIPDQWNAHPRTAFASYHSTFDIKENVVVNFEAVPGNPSGAFALNDYYLVPIDKGTIRNPNNILINSHPGVRTSPPQSQHVYGVIWDPLNYWGGPTGRDNNYVFDNPFFTHGLTKHIVSPSSNISGGVIVDGPFYGVYQYYINNTERRYEKIDVTRTDLAGNTIGNWTVEAGQYGDILGNMRHFATHPTGYYYLDFPTIDNINKFQITVSNMLTDNDFQVLSVEYSGNYTITNLFSSTAYNAAEFGTTVPYPTNQQNVHTYTRVSSFQDVVNAPQGEVYWQDRANNKVWFKIRGGVNSGYSDLPATADKNLYKEFNVYAYGQFGTLPITFSLFDVHKISDTKVNLVWKYETDQETANFEIERMVEGRLFETIKKINNTKSKIGLNEYLFSDENPDFGTNYYRIKSTDVNGKVEYTPIKSVQINSLQENALVIYPNPAKSTLKVSFGAKVNGISSLKIFNSLGATLKQETLKVNVGRNETEINLDDLNAGIYYLSIQTTNGISQTKTFIKN